MDPNDAQGPVCTERCLYLLLQQRNPDAFYVLVELYAVRLEVTLQRKFGGYIDNEDIKDIVADTFLRAFRTGERFDPKIARASTWLNTLAHYEALEFLRKRKYLTNIPLDDLANRLVDQVENVQAIVIEQPSPKMEAFLQKLPQRRAQTIRMYYYNNLSIDAIAEELGITASAVRSNLSRGRQDLGDLIGEAT